MRTFSLWGKKFWNGFFHPRHPGVFLVLLNILATIAFLCIYVLIPIYYGAFSSTHNAAYLLLFISNVLVIFTGILVIGFLTMPPDDTSLKRCIFVYLCHLVCLGTGLVSLGLFLTTPTNEEMTTFLVHYFSENERSPTLMAKLETERACCGINGISDFFPTNPSHRVRLLPDSCCKKSRLKCGDFRNKAKDIKDEGLLPAEILNTTAYYVHGCFGKGRTFSDLRTISPSVHSSLSLITHLAWINILLLFTLATIFSYYVFYRLPLEHDRPRWTSRCVCCIHTCCPKKLFATASNHDIRRNSWRISTDKLRQSKIASSSGDGEDELDFERSELYVGPPQHHRPDRDQHHNPPLPSDIGSLVSSTTSEGPSQLT